MNDMLEPQTVRAKRLALRNLQEACEIYQKTQIQKGRTFTSTKKSEKFLGQLIRNIRVNRLSQYVTQNLLMNNVFGKRIDFSIKGSKEVDEERMIKWVGVRFNEKVLGIIYILEIVFVLVTLFLSSFVAFLQGFRNLEYQTEKSIVAMNIFAIFFSICKIGTSIVTKKIKDGITLVYISDIFYDYVISLVIFVDLAYLIMLICLLIEASMLLAMANASDTSNWLITKNLADKEWWVQYLWAYYWATTIMMTIGFGDITATTHSQAIVLAFLEFFSCIVLAYNVSQIGAVISALRSAGNQYQKKISIFKRMAAQDQIDIELKTKIEGYLKEEREINETYEFHEQSQLLNSIPDNLKKEYVNQSNKKFFTYIPFFKNIRKATLMKFTQHFNGRVYYPGEFLLSLHEDHQNIMILKEGKVGLTYKKQGSRLNGTPVQCLEIEEKMVHVERDVFQKKIVPIILNTNFLSRTSKTNYEIIAESYCFAYSIGYENFLSCIKESEVDSSYYFSILHRTSISKNEWVQIECQKCNNENQISEELDIEKNRQRTFFMRAMNIESLKHEKRKEYHTKFQCPKLHFCPLKGIIILKSLKSRGYPQRGNRTFKRHKKRQQHSYLNKKIFQPFEERINITAKKRLQEMIINDYQESLKNSKVSQMIQNHGYFTLDSTEQVQMLQKLIKKSLHEVIQGYEEGYWDLQIDVMNNYLSYFPTNNASNFDNTPLQAPEDDEEEVVDRRRYNEEQQKVLISEIQEFEKNIENARNSRKNIHTAKNQGNQTLPHHIRTSKLKINTSEGNQEGKRYHFKKIRASDVVQATGYYSPKDSNKIMRVDTEEDHIFDESDTNEREQSITHLKVKQKSGFVKRKSSS